MANFRWSQFSIPDRKVTLMRTLLVAIGFILATLGQALSQETATSPGKVSDFIRLLQDPQVRTWLESQPIPQDEPSAPQETLEIAGWEQTTRNRINGILSAFPRIPSEVAKAAARTRADAISHGYAPVFILFAALVLLGTIAETIFRRFIPRNSMSPATPRSMGATALAEFVPVLIFAATMAAVFFAFSWPQLARISLLVYLIAFVAYRLLSTTVHIAMPPSPLRQRIRFFLGTLTLAIACATIAHPLGVPTEVREAISYLFSIILLALAMEALWRSVPRSRTAKIALTFSLLAIWLFWALSLPGLFWIGIYALVLPGILRAVGTLAGSVTAPSANTKHNDFRQVLIVRGSRAVVVILAVAWLSVVWRYNPNSVAYQDPRVAAVLFGALKSVGVILIADMLWGLMKVAIDRKLEHSSAELGLPPEETARRSRLRTLLPILRNGLAAVVLIMSGLIVLSELGVEIAPLIAGAGIFGVALGFGSQTLVKDIISGVFYMFDDAFRVGEYIQSKSYKGTVEGFSLRSVRLRHHRGPVFTVPFGELGAVQNMSRDWGVVKFRISVTYDTDLEKARRVTKKIGVALMEDPELGPIFIEPLKMKGLEEFGDYGVVLSFGMMLRPSPLQSMIRRRANMLIREAFKENGIEFATPSVQVGNDDRDGAAAAATAIRMQQNKVTAVDG
ncbi:mechanosensitive ion channel family protein [Agrobacterium tumefaciens]|uniref:mechanosensitive ion channel family protein n=1 Tax=Agrobacterium tumefaciens TaxID=358 RepID=UPI001F3B705E|nr:mechanosensitive ion channel family protein [Agrobacterium tumefaciens]